MVENIRRNYMAHGCRLGVQGFRALAAYRFGRWRHHGKHLGARLSASRVEAA